MKLRKDQWVTITILICVNLYTTAIYSLQAPFYPAEAQRKGVSATEYGFVFGSYELISFLIGPLAGKTVEKYSFRFLSSGGMMLSSIAIILFGLVDRIQSRVLFVAVSVTLRIVESIGTTVSLVSGFSLLGAMFDDNLATVFATLEIFYGCGIILGPVIGGALFTIGGFSLPFYFFGVIGITITALILAFYHHIPVELPKNDENHDTLSVLKIPTIALNLAYVVMFTISSSLCSALLEPHLRQFHLSPFATSLFFVTNGFVYALISPIFGKWVDRGLEPRTLLITSCVLVIVGFTIIGPAPFIPYNATIASCIIAMVMQGFAFGSGNVATFTDLFRSFRHAGSTDSIGTFGLVSGLWASSFALGAFLGPTIGGVLYDLVGFRWATQFVSISFVVMLIVIVVFTIVTNKREREKYEMLQAFIVDAERAPLLSEVLMENK